MFSLGNLSFLVVLDNFHTRVNFFHIYQLEFFSAFSYFSKLTFKFLFDSCSYFILLSSHLFSPLCLLFDCCNFMASSCSSLNASSNSQYLFSSTLELKLLTLLLEEHLQRLVSSSMLSLDSLDELESLSSQAM